MLATAFCWFNPVCAQVANVGDAFAVEATWSVDAAKPGQPIVLAIVVDVSGDYYIGNAATSIPPKNKDDVMPTQVKLPYRDKAVEQEKWNRLQIKRAVDRVTVGARFANGAATSTEG